HYLRSGRIRPEHLDQVLASMTPDTRLAIGARTVTHRQVLRACLTEGLGLPAVEPLDSQLADPSHSRIGEVTARLESVLKYPDLTTRIRAIVESDEAALGRWLTLSHWCDDTLGTHIVGDINDQLIKWCEAFLDEGHATWVMPEREKGLYQAWKIVAAHE